MCAQRRLGSAVLLKCWYPIATLDGIFGYPFPRLCAFCGYMKTKHHVSKFMPLKKFPWFHFSDPTNLAKMLSALTILWSLACIGLVTSSPTGPPASACVSMAPSHGSQAQTSTAPYTLSFSKNTYTYSPNEQITGKFNKHIYAPNFEEVEGACWFGPVCISICPLCLAYGQEQLEIGSWNLINGISMKNKWTHIFSSPEPKAHKVSL